MGTDIHMRVEIQENGVWNPFSVPRGSGFHRYDCPTWVRDNVREGQYETLREGQKGETISRFANNDEIDAWYEARERRWETEPNESYWAKMRQYDWRMGRNYNLFAILADVRNGRGFAGVLTGEGFIPIDEPRGYPDDVCELYKHEPIEHSPSWLSLEDVHNFPHWRDGSRECGLVGPQVYKDWVENSHREGCPLSWCGGRSGTEVNNSEYDRYLNDLPPLDQDRGVGFLDSSTSAGIPEVLKDTYTRIWWTVTYKDCAGTEFWRLVEILMATMQEKELEPNQVRMVFYFDS